jgi:alkylation response protein AidB-like acyl-CoA dehydrogenase
VTPEFDIGDDARALRARLRDLIDEEIPSWFRGPFVDDERAHEVVRRFCATLANQQLLTMDWPREYGGTDASIWEQTVLREEMWAHHEPRGPQYMGLSWVGPAIMTFGSDEQKARHLPPIAAGEVVWCQGFSEPEAGSDLAALKLRAERDGDGWRLYGQKIWTSYATLAHWCFLAARTSNGGRKQEGITIFLLPMSSEGVTARPIDSMMGPHHLNEVFFDGALVGAADVLGEVDRGWDVITAVLSFERVGIPRYARSDHLLAQLWHVIEDRGDAIPPELRVAHARALVRCRIARLLAYRVIADRENGGAASADPSIARIASTLLDQEVAELAAEVLGPNALSDSHDVPLRGDVEDVWRYARTATVAAGTTEIQRMLVARALTRAVKA